MPETPPVAPPVIVPHRWLDPAVVAVALIAAASGFGQFGAVAALGEVAKTFGHANSGATIAEQAGLSGTELGLGLAALRLASLGGLPLSSLADRLGRRSVLIWTCALGLGFTVCAALSPSYWWFVAIFAIGRPFLSATNAVAQVGAAEETGSLDRAKAVALVAAGYGVGAGLTAVINGLFNKSIGFRGLFALAAIPLVAVLLLAPRIQETDRFRAAQSARTHETFPMLGQIPARFRRRLLIVSGLALVVSVVTGPATSFVFVYAENVIHLSGKLTALMVVVAAIFGLAGLVIGRAGADHFGRRPACAASMVAMVLAAVLTYSGGRVDLLAGYELEVLAAASFAPGAGALANELFPTSVRASVAGWNVVASVVGAVIGLVAFGSVADIDNRFAFGAQATFLPMLAGVLLFIWLPETSGRELEELWPADA